MRTVIRTALLLSIVLLLAAGGSVLAQAGKQTDSESGIVYVVPKGWNVIRRFGTTSAWESPDGRASVTVAFVRSNSRTLEEIHREFMFGAERSYPEFTLIAMEQMQLAQKTVLRITFDFNMKFLFRQQHVKVPRPGGYVDLVFSTFAQEWSRNEAAFKQIQSSVTFLF